MPEPQSNDFLANFHLNQLKFPDSLLSLTDSFRSKPAIETTNYNEHPIIQFSRLYLPELLKFLTPQTSGFLQSPENDVDILGSGNFGVLRGGTFYADDDDNQPQPPNEQDDYISAYSSNSHDVNANGDDFVRAYTTSEEQFKEFRDFADLNNFIKSVNVEGTPAETDSSSSTYILVYAANNSTTNPKLRSKKRGRQSYPQNILEKLQEIDEEKAELAKQQRKTFAQKKFDKCRQRKNTGKKCKFKIKSDPLDEPLLAIS